MMYGQTQQRNPLESIFNMGQFNQGNPGYDFGPQQQPDPFGIQAHQQKMEQDKELLKLKKMEAKGFETAQDAKRKMAELQAPQQKQAFGAKDLAPVIGLALLAKLLGAKDRDIAEGGAGFMQGRQAYRQTENENAMNAYGAQRHGLEAIAGMGADEAQFYDGQAKDLENTQRYDQGLLAKERESTLGFERDKEMLGIRLAETAKQKALDRDLKVKSAGWQAAKSRSLAALKRAWELKDENAKTQVVAAIMQTDPDGDLLNDPDIVKALSGETFGEAQKKASTKGVELTNEQKKFRNEMDAKYGEELKKLEVAAKTQGNVNAGLQADKMRRFLFEAPIRLADHLKRTAISVSHLNERIRAAGASEELSRWTAANKPMIEQQIQAITDLKKKAAKAEENQALGYNDKEGNRLQNADELEQLDIDAIQEAEFMIPLLNNQIEAITKTVPGPKSGKVPSASGAAAGMRAGAAGGNQQRIAALADQGKKAFPGIRTEIPGPGSIANSLHPSRQAVDFRGIENLQSVAEWAIKQPGVQTVIYNRRVWKPGKGWAKYTGPHDHTDHVHVDYGGYKSAKGATKGASGANRTKGGRTYKIVG